MSRSSAGDLIGRDALIEGALALIEGGARLLTLRGTVGVGKARIASALAERLVAARRIAAVRSVPLRGVEDRAAIERALEDALGALRARQACLVLEGCEDGREAVVRWLEARLEPSEELLVIATSRTRLGLAVEHVVAVEPLAEDDAIALFGRLAAAARGELWEETPDAVHEIRALVRRLGALPLVLELAAAQASALSVRDLLARRDVALDLLASPHPRPRPSEATLRDAVEGALARLDPGAMRVLQACATFEGSFVLEDVEAILAALAAQAPRPIARELARLADASLVAVTRPGAEAWLAVHPPIRLLARERAGPHRDALRRAWAARVLDEARSLAEGPPVVHARSPLARLHEDLVVLAAAADDEARTLDPDDVAVRALALLARTRGPVAETIEALDRACARTAPADSARLGRLRHLRGVLHRRAGDLTRARDDLDAAAAHAAAAGDAALAIRIELDRAHLHRHVGEDEAARAGYDRALEACRQSHDAIGEGLALGALAAMAHERGDLAEATRRYAEVDRVTEELVRRGGDATALATVHHNGGLLLAERGDLAGAERAYRRALAEHRASGDRRFEGIAEHDLGCLALERREVAAARAHFARAEPIAREVGDRRELGLCRARLGICEAMLGDQARAERWIASSSALLEGAGEPGLLEALAVCRAHLAVAELRLLQQRGEPLAPALVDEVRGALARGEPSASGDELRLARRILAADAALALRADRIVVAPDGAWFSTPRWGRVSLARKPTLARLLAALVVASVERPGSALSAEALARAGWPATRTLSPSAKNRLYVAVTALRKLGLGDALAREGDGYRLVDVDLGARSGGGPS